MNYILIQNIIQNLKILQFQSMKEKLRSNAIKWIIFKFKQKLEYDVLSENTGFSYKDLDNFSKDFIIHI